MTTYLLLLTLHIVAFTLWIGGMLILALAMNNWRNIPALELSPSLHIFNAVHRWDRTVTLPAMILSWLSGLALLMMGNWPPSNSLLIKGVFVLALSALHGIQSGSFRRSLGESTLQAPAFLRHAGGLTLAALIIILLLIELKPF
ncbi:CopD family protein [Acerihabitans sp. KWT182]|uniref:Protoporphyrinogen IX oxidase n=1 Tax=Acerihabitans sp. KWT182 TaxID=3157919 RepID=A0AAU7QAQ3_9GAMM